MSQPYVDPRATSYWQKLLVRATVVVAAALGSAKSYAQHVLARHDGATGDRLGAQVAALGDVDLDGVPDYAIASPLADTTHLNIGRVSVYSGATHAELWSVYGTSWNERLGTVDGAGDVDGDGAADVIVGAPLHDSSGSDRGEATVYSGATGLSLFHWSGSAPGDEFGTAVTGAGDVDGDGVADVAVAARYALSSMGVVTIYSGSSGAVIRSFTGRQPLSQLGIALDDAGDVDLDGLSDLIVAEMQFSPDRNVVHVYSGANGSELYKFVPEFGSNITWPNAASAGDVDGDGVPDIAAAAPTNDRNGLSSGEVTIWSGASGSLLHRWNGDAPNDQFGEQLAAAGDVDGDGFGDVLAGGTQDSFSGSPGPGYARLFSGRTGNVLYTFHGQQQSDHAAFVAGVGDVDLDGHPDWVVGAPDIDSNGTDAGSAWILAGKELFLACDPDVAFAQDQVTMRTRDGMPGNAVLIVLVDVNGTSMFAPIASGIFDLTGTFELRGTVPTGLAGKTLLLRSYAIAASGNLVDSFDEALDLR